MEPTSMQQAGQAAGGCLCGAISIKIKNTSRVIRTMACHCRHCQKGAGGPCQVNALFKKDDVEVLDAGSALRRYLFPGEDVASGVQKEKWFCSICGCTMFTKPMKHGGAILVIKTGIMDEPGRAEFIPQQEYYASIRQIFMPPIANAVQVETMPVPKPT